MSLYEAAKALLEALCEDDHERDDCAARYTAGPCSCGYDDLLAKHIEALRLALTEAPALGREEVALRSLVDALGYPWLPCPICKGVEGCDHSVPERARSALQPREEVMRPDRRSAEPTPATQPPAHDNVSGADAEALLWDVWRRTRYNPYNHSAAHDVEWNDDWPADLEPMRALFAAIVEATQAALAQPPKPEVKG